AAPGAPPGAAPAAQAAAVATAQNSATNHKETTTNYDVDHTISHTRLPVGVVRHLSVAVILNNHTVTDKAGKISERPFSESEKAQMSTLIKDAVGFDDKRGDALSLLNSPFVEQKDKVVELPLWKQPENISLAKDALKYLIIVGLALYLLLGIVRPAVRNFNQALNPTPVEKALDEFGAEESTGGEDSEEGLEGAGYTDSGAPVAASSYETNLNSARQMAMQEPAIVASVLKDWINGNE
ncbi:MAG: flagellar basal body M-ring protein FliF, partial [Ferrovum sp.]|nr:flagellar basal body M-ring protein FliF [Ferrovum sp.]